MTDEQIREILESTKTIAAVGLSSKPARASHGVARFLQIHDYQVIPVNPGESEVLGEQAYPDLDSVPEPVDLVLVFRAPEYVPPIVEAAIRIGAKTVWMQDGAGNEEAAERARDAGLAVVVNDCVMRQYARLDSEMRIKR